MSYILEALKKAQAERQLGSAPTIHALPMHAPVAEKAGTRRGPVLAILGAAVLVAGALAWYLLRAPAPVPAPVAVAVAPEPAAAVPTPPRAAVRAPAVVPFPQAAPPAPKPVASKPEPALAPAQEENLKTLRELPDAVQREVPSVAIGGYIYSKNPADRLLLIDKILRKEGDEVAPGLVLEKLLPKAAVMNYRGTRYRVPY